MTASDFITVAQEEDVVEVLSKHSITLADFTHFVGRIKADIRLREKLYEYSMDDFIKLYRLTYAV